MFPRSILAVTDFSLQGSHAISRAALLCAQHSSTLNLIYLAPVDEAHPPDAAVRLSHHALQLQRRHEIQVHAATRIGLTVGDVACEAKGADLVVWGTAPRRGPRAWFTAHPVIHLLRASKRPVVVLHHLPDQPYQSVMVAVDFSQASQRLVELSVAMHPSAQVELFHAINTTDEGKLRYAEVSEQAIRMYREECRRHAQDRMFTLTDSYDARRNRLSSSIGRGDPARQVLVQQQNSASDLIVVGKHPASRLSDLLFESVAVRVLRHACTDVLVVPHGFQAVSRSAAVERLAADMPVRRIKAGAARPPSYPSSTAVQGRT